MENKENKGNVENKEITSGKKRPKSNRSRLIGLIHFQKTALAISDDEYRVIIHGATGKNSCSDCDMNELFAIFDDLNSVLEQKGKYRFYFHKNKEGSKLTLQDVIILRAQKAFGDAWFSRLQGFLKSKGKTSLADCDSKDCRQIMGWISTENRRNKNGTERK